MKILVTGGAGFIGSALIRYLIKNTTHFIINIDKLTYAGNLATLNNVTDNDRYTFERIDICSQEHLDALFLHYQPDAVIHLAAETHVDRSIHGPETFIKTNVLGTYSLLEATRTYWQALTDIKKTSFRFLHISTDEVFGDLANSQGFFTETTAYAPSSPYSASKASADHLVNAWYRTYGLPTLISNCSNNYGPFQYPEKLIPLTIANALSGKPIPIYGKGTQIRDWLYVDDHVHALYTLLTHGRIGSSYVIGGHNEKQNIEVVQTICHLLEELSPTKPEGIKQYTDLITYVKDRQGHDIRYAISAKKIQQELGWIPSENFETGMRKTVEWYLHNPYWLQDVIQKHEVIA